jgi:hypothetical protein
MKIYAPYILSRFGKVLFQHYRRQPSTSARHFRQFCPLVGNQIQLITSIRPLAIDRATHQEGPVRGCHPRDGKGVPVGNRQSQMPSPLVIVVPRDERGEEGRIGSRRVPQHRRRIAPPCPVRAERENQHPPIGIGHGLHERAPPVLAKWQLIHGNSRIGANVVPLDRGRCPTLVDVYPRTYIDLPSIVATTTCSRRGMSNGAHVSHPALHSCIIDGGPANPPSPTPASLLEYQTINCSTLSQDTAPCFHPPTAYMLADVVPTSSTLFVPRTTAVHDTTPNACRGDDNQPSIVRHRHPS